MTHTYQITGMTCEGCAAKVSHLLKQVPGVSAADVQLATGQATIQMDHHLAESALQQALGDGKYTISASISPALAAETTAGSPSYYPIFLIFGYIAGITLLLQLAKGHFYWQQWMGTFMAGFFLLFSFFKLLNLNGFADGYASYDIIAHKVHGYGYVYPFIELALGIAYLTGFSPLLTNVVTLIVMSVSSIGVIQSLVQKSSFECACLGTIIKLPLSKVTLVEDLLMVVMSAVMALDLTHVI